MNQRLFEIGLVFSYLLLSVSGVLLLKAGLKGSEFKLGDPLVLTLSPTFVAGLVAYVCSFLLWFPVLARHDVSYIFPVLSGTAQIVLLLGSIWLLGERPGSLQIIGVIVVATGIAMMHLGPSG